jgi:hypothetical protein
MAKSPQEQEQTMVNNLREKTGKTLEQWLKITKASKLAKHGEVVNMLKGDHGITHGFANLIAHRTLESSASSSTEEDLVAVQYAGEKAALMPIYDELVKKINAFGSDVELAPKKAYVSLRRNKQFGILQPSTKTRLDVGINLKGVEPGGRLEKSGSFNAMVTHRVRVESKKDVDAELIGWLKQAYAAS